MVQKQPPEVFCKKAILTNSAMLTGKHLCLSLFLIKLQFLCLAKLLNLPPRKTSTDKILASFSQNILDGIRFTKAVNHKTQ